jgi:hypothetical protein
MLPPSRCFSLIVLGLLSLVLEIGIPARLNAATPAGKKAPPSVSQAEHVVLFVLEGFSRDSL